MPEDVEYKLKNIMNFGNILDIDLTSFEGQLDSKNVTNFNFNFSYSNCSYKKKKGKPEIS